MKMKKQGPTWWKALLLGNVVLWGSLAVAEVPPPPLLEIPAAVPVETAAPTTLASPLNTLAAEAEKEKDRKAAASLGTAFEPEMVSISGGTFTMGCVESRDNVAGGCDDDEKPAHQVSLSDFQIGRYEVTFEQWDACEKAKACPHAYDEGWGRGKRPVINVSWNDITQKYIPWLNQQTGGRYRLPTEAEWEYAARGGTDTAYPWGNSISCSNAAYGYISCGNEKTKPVGSYTANGYGLHDMQGNVWEWVSDWGGAYAAEPQQDPQGASSGTYRVLRGGSWSFSPWFVRSANRYNFTPLIRFSGIGFRLAQGQ